MNIEKINVNETDYQVGLPNIYINSKGNFNIETSAEIGNTSKGKINIESMDDLQLKPGDDIILYSSHRAVDKRDEVAVKVTDSEDNPIKLQIQAGEITLSTKGKGSTKTKDTTTGEDTNTNMYDDDEVLDVNVTTGKKNGNKKGYLKVRARAIDLRCEEHGGVALQPNGYDGQGNMNKIKFEHGGGDGLEFGTFNTEHSSLYTTDYRFKKDGVIRLATRQTQASDKAQAGNATTQYKYVKQGDDFYDVINVNDPTCTWEDIVTYIAWAKQNNQGPWANAA